MDVDANQLMEFFQGLSIFSALDEQQIRGVVQYAGVLDFRSGDYVVNQGEEGLFFFILFKGQVSTSHLKRRMKSQIGVLVSGDYFGEEALLFNQPNQMTVTAISDGTLIYISKNDFLTLMDEYPEIKNALVRMVNSRRFVRKNKFDWINEAGDEVVYQVRRKHIAFLFVAIVPPLLLMFFSILFAVLMQVLLTSKSINNIAFFLAGFLSLIALLWGIWVSLDWKNDIYILTNRRVLWIERILLIYESRVEAPLDTILSVNVSSSYIGRILGYGDVMVKTFTGQVPFRGVGDPDLMSALVEEHWNRAVLGIQKEEERTIDQSIREIIHNEKKDDVKEYRANKPLSDQEKGNDLPDFKEPGIRATYFGKLFAVRIEEGDIITFRKHWISLIEKAWIPSLIIFLVVFAVLFYDFFYIIGEIQFGSPFLIQAVTFLILFLFIIPWWLYNYIDWCNDIYQLTDKNIFDIERKPFGKEIKKSAPIENILSLEHERPGLIGYLLNFGNVTINIGEVKFIFRDVYEPARVQQDIFDRMYSLRKKRKQIEADHQRDRILAVMDSYHRNTRDLSDDR
jgi:uncharacterized membrane protein YdbT with pleckstrin-like domain